MPRAWRQASDASERPLLGSTTMPDRARGTISMLVAAALLSLALGRCGDSAGGPTQLPSDKTKLMKAVVYHEYGSPDVLSL